ncbi:hypothetical protein GH714_033022 [Hevea brasiliensis]|uniref:Pectate lyase n=1 Tax=Hevea brasiliensis TaxID=3981 RepID=A0A6A6L3F8_HEVBR|nr:hypothetical protein GH714_033022 [Hevea brasiliensis]
MHLYQYGNFCPPRKGQMPNWKPNRRLLALRCQLGQQPPTLSRLRHRLRQGALGGRGGQIYIVTDSSDRDPTNPTPGTLRYGVIQEEPLWIIFSTSMTIKLKHELIFNSYKTIDGRGANVHITGNGCITLQYVSHIIIHNIHVHNCKPSGNTNIASSPTHVGYRGRSDGDGISIFGSQKIWIDHCTLSYCTDGLIDAIMGSTGITISNNYFSHHDEVMLLGHDDKYVLDSGMQVTIAFNRFGEALVQRMPRCRRGDNNGGMSNSGNGYGTSTSTTNTGSAGSGGDGDYFGMIFGSGAPPPTSTSSIFLSLVIIFNIVHLYGSQPWCHIIISIIMIIIMIIVEVDIERESIRQDGLEKEGKLIWSHCLANIAIV